MGRAVLHRLLWVVEFEQTVNKAAGEAVASANAIQNLQIASIRRFVELSARPANRAPVVAGGRLDRPQGRSSRPPATTGARFAGRAESSTKRRIDAIWRFWIALAEATASPAALFTVCSNSTTHSRRWSTARPMEPWR